MKSVVSVLLFLSFLFIKVCICWPPVPPPVPPTTQVDISGYDLGGMPITLNSDNFTLCEELCQKTPSCRAWAYGLPNCGPDSSSPRCWLKYYVGASSPNTCRTYGIVNTRVCLMETAWTHRVDPLNPLPEYPRPQLIRANEDPKTWKNLNGLWQFQFGTSVNDQPPFGKTLNSIILVPFPVESCLSGIGKTGMYLWYRLLFNTPFTNGNTLLHFGSVDWQTTVYINQQVVGNHTGGYDGFSFDVTKFLQSSGQNELLIFVYDPTNYGRQVFGKQKIEAITGPGGDTYTPSSGIWQTVWLENVPTTFIRKLNITTDTSSASITVFTNQDGMIDNMISSSFQSSPSAPLPVTIDVRDGDKIILSKKGVTNSPVILVIPTPQLWSPQSPFLYNITVTLDNVTDSITSYFGLRTISIGKDQNGITRPLINGKFTFLAGWLDQSFWPDGAYTAPTEEALAFDVYSIKRFGFNFVRLHQKVNPELWYYYCDRLGVIVQQDMIQHFGDDHSTPDPDIYMRELKAMIDGRYNHPSIIQWTAFNEGDMVSHFNPPVVANWIKNYDPSRLVDTDSGGPGNDLHVADVNDVHAYPDPSDPKPSSTQYAEIGEFGGLGTYQTGHQWIEGLCGSYENCGTADQLATRYIGMTQYILQHKKDISVSVYTQITDVELECDGFLNYDRTDKFSPSTLEKIVKANQNMING